MKKAALLFFLFNCTFLLAQEGKTIKLTPTEVTVYLDKARVTSSFTTQLKAGENQLKIVGIPNDADNQTYQVATSGGVELQNVTPQINYLDEGDYTDKVQQLLDVKEELTVKKDLILAEKQSLEEEIKLIQENAKIGNSNSGWETQQLVELSAFYREKILEIRKQLIVLRQKELKTSEEYQAINQQIQQENAHKNLNRNEVMLEINSNVSKSATIHFSYVTNNASWYPTYDIRAISTIDPIKIVYKANIRQKTGTDWENVKLNLSTYQPRVNQRRPILQPLYVHEQPKNKSVANQLNKQVAGISVEETMINSYEMEMDVADTPVAEVQENELNLFYQINGEQTVESSGKHQTIIVDNKTVPADYVYHTVPKKAAEAFLLANVKNWQDLNLIQAEANIYFENNYVGKTVIDPNFTKKELPISLGVDKRIVVQRKKLNEKNTKKWLRSKAEELFTYQISVKNNTGKNIDIEVLDQIPISQNHSIEVEAIDMGDGKLDEQTKSVMWEKNLSAGENIIIPLVYKLTYPKEMQLNYKN